MSESTEASSPDVTITTLPFALTSKTYFWISLRNTFWMIWWCFLFLILLDLLYIGNDIATYLSTGETIEFAPIVIFTSFMGVLLFVWIIFVCYRRTHHPANRVLYQERQLTISRNQVVAFQADEGNLWKYTKDQFYGIEILGWCYLLFVTPQMMVMIPKTAIANEQDRAVLENEILPAYAKRKRRIWPGLLISLGCLAFVLLLGYVLASM